MTPAFSVVPENSKKSASFLHTGDCGDCIFGIPVMQALGGGDLFLAASPWTKSMMGLYEPLAALINAQPGLTCSPYDGRKIDYDLSTFRNGGQKFGETIVQRHARWMRVKVDISKPWLQADPDPRTKRKIVVSRTARWQGFQFPWRQIVETFRDDILFIGSYNEHKIFCKEFGQVELFPTKTLLDVATAIQGAELFIGNQSSPNAVAEGLHKDSILEVCSYACDCFYHRSNVVHCVDGKLAFHACGKKFIYGGYAAPFGFSFQVGDVTIKSAISLNCGIMARAEHIRQGFPDPGEITPTAYQTEIQYAAA